MNYLFVLPKNNSKISWYNIFPFGVAYVSAYLKSQGHSVFTANLEFDERDTTKAMTALLREHEIDVLCVSGLSRDYPRIKVLIDCGRAVNEHLIVVAGGGIVTADAETAMQALGADIGVIGQGEVTMHELATALDGGLPMDAIPGLIYRRNGGYVTTPARREIADLDSLPLPDYEGFRFPEFMKQVDYRVAYVIASRSCPYRCTFCFHPSGKKYRRRSLDSVFGEIDLLINRYGARSIAISDELFSIDRDRILDFCDRIASFKTPWSVALRVSDVDRQLLDTMKRAGCTEISYGIESADDTILKSMRKKITRAQTERALELTFDAGIEIQGGMIFGDVAETPATVANTLRWYDDHLRFNLNLNMIEVFPGTPLYHQAHAHGIIPDKIDFLRDGCPLINVSKLSDDEYRRLASAVYERNMLAKYEPETYELSEISEEGTCMIRAQCNRCQTTFDVSADPFHVTQTRCPQCRQRYYVDPMNFMQHDGRLPTVEFADAPSVALWGAGELCIKMLDRFPALHDDRFVVVDSSKSRQGYTVRGKTIHAPEHAIAAGANAVIVTVIRRKDEILGQIADLRWPADIYLPEPVRTGTTGLSFGLAPMGRAA
jgi:anaerobic magnesium-protoporphyrin IX monomethyl ester cyclase